MRVVMVMFDSLNRHFLSPYGCEWTHTPNFMRLSQRAVTFERSYVCSMPCMPARRDLHTGRPNFLHRSWGPLEPFDDSMPQILKQNGIYTRLCTDHQHYWEDGGATYHQRYSTFDFIRGQEGDKWHGLVDGIAPNPKAFGRNALGKNSDSLEWQDRVNRHFIQCESHFPQSRTFASGLQFIEQNHHSQNWFLQIETFDPHEPFFADEKYKRFYESHYLKWKQEDGRHWDWPGYEPLDPRQHSKQLIEHIRYEYAALISMCDEKLGSVLAIFDKYDLWKDTMLVVWTDHGFLLGEHDWWAKIRMPWWNELANTPFFIWDPRFPETAGTRRNALVQPSIDLAPTLLRFFGLDPTSDMLGYDLADIIRSDQSLRSACIFGVHGAHVNVTDGRYVYMRAPTCPDNKPLYEYTLMPTHMHRLFLPESLTPDRVALAKPFSFTKGCVTMRIGAAPQKQSNRSGWYEPVTQFSHLLYDLETDPGQTRPIQDSAIESRMCDMLVHEMKRCDSPPEQFERLGLV